MPGNECPRCKSPCSVRYREVPKGKWAQLVCGKCIQDLGLPPGGFGGKTPIELARKIAVGLASMRNLHERENRNGNQGMEIRRKGR